MATEHDLLVRIEKLEVANLRLKWSAGLFLVLLIALAVVGRVGSKGIVEAHEFLLKDHAGRTVARLSENNLATCFEILGKANQAGAELCAGDEYGSSLSLTNHQGESRALLSAGSRQLEGLGNSLVPSLLIAELDGKNVVSATVGSETRLLVGHGTEKNSILLSAHPSELRMSVLGKDGKPIWNTP